MPDYRRWRVDGGTYFLTVVAHERRHILTSELARPLLRRAVAEARRRRPFDVLGVVLLPDHLHTIWRLPADDRDYSLRMSAIKERFTRTFLAAGGSEGASTPSRQRQGYRGVWQKRFIEHTIRDFEDFRRHLDYIHTNPVKHGYVERPLDWQWSSFHQYVRRGWYEPDWSGSIVLPGTQFLEPGET